MRVTINTEQVRACSLRHLGNCTKGPLHRHHTGNDGYLARFCPSIARKYDLFLDCEDLCRYHHMAVHCAYRDSGLEQKLHSLSSQKAILALRLDFVVLFHRIKSGEVKLKKVGKFFREQWKRTETRWKNQG